MASSIAAGYEPWLVGRARGLNEHLPLHVARRFVELIRETRGAVAGGRALLLGFAYKGWPPTDDMRGAPVAADARRSARRGSGPVRATTSSSRRRPSAARCDARDARRGLRRRRRRAGRSPIIRSTASKTCRSFSASLRRPAVLYDSWRVLDEETVRAARRPLRLDRLWLECCSSAGRGSSAITWPSASAVRPLTSRSWTISRAGGWTPSSSRC
jgi:UDP-N-acetyl-D-mannosaminuronic acid dehydrogenase